MGTTDRRQSIIKLLCRCRHATIAELSDIYSVSERTISRDIVALSMYEPIYTKCGRSEGGVYLMDGYYADHKRLSDEEIRVLIKIYEYIEMSGEEIISEEEKAILKMIIDRSSAPL